MTQIVTLEAITNREDWSDQCQVTDENDTLIDLSAATIVLSVRNKTSKSIVMTASTDEGTITIDALGIFGFSFPLSQMRNLCAELYDVGCTIERGGVTQQFFIGTISVLDGVVA